MNINETHFCQHWLKSQSQRGSAGQTSPRSHICSIFMQETVSLHIFIHGRELQQKQKPN